MFVEHMKTGKNILGGISERQKIKPQSLENQSPILISDPAI